MRPIGSGQQDVGHLGVATGRGAFHLSPSISVGEETQRMEVSLYVDCSEGLLESSKMHSEPP
ncbi:hypothetical protein [Rummeliibacillus suwonensis]|uniref:hypothetical protein n=1 Tax=Rummeliibacillus suwonensis TaxID=1306154 RepID=UPI0028A264A8|nr:hypothetical protein [Rummeliibacillus suwonensis]